MAEYEAKVDVEEVALIRPGANFAVTGEWVEQKMVQSCETGGLSRRYLSGIVGGRVALCGRGVGEGGGGEGIRGPPCRQASSFRCGDHAAKATTLRSSRQ